MMYMCTCINMYAYGKKCVWYHLSLIQMNFVSDDELQRLRSRVLYGFIHTFRPHNTHPSVAAVEAVPRLDLLTFRVLRARSPPFVWGRKTAGWSRCRAG